MTYSELVQLVQDYTQNYETTFVADIPMFVEQAEQRIFNTIQFPSIRKNVTGSFTQYNQYLSLPSDFLAVYSLAVYQNASPTATGTSGAYTITVSTASNITLGQIASGTGIALGATVTGINGLVVTLNLPNTGTVSGTVTFQGSQNFLINKDVNFIREAYGNPIAYGTPQYYALFGPTVVSGNITTNLTIIAGPTPDTAYLTELHYYYYPVSLVQSAINTTSIYAPGSGYTNGTFYNQPLTGGTGSGARADIVVSGGVVTSVTLNYNGSYYAVGDILGATLNGGSGFQLQVTAVNNPTGTSWLAQNFDTVLLYGTLVEAYTFMKGEADMVKLYSDRYTEALALAKRLGDGMERGDAYRNGQYRQAVQ